MSQETHTAVVKWGKFEFGDREYAVIAHMDTSLEEVPHSWQLMEDEKVIIEVPDKWMQEFVSLVKEIGG